MMPTRRWSFASISGAHLEVQKLVLGNRQSPVVKFRSRRKNRNWPRSFRTSIGTKSLSCRWNASTRCSGREGTFYFRRSRILIPLLELGFQLI
jgi:hypothetical protein